MTLIGFIPEQVRANYGVNCDDNMAQDDFNEQLIVKKVN